MGKIPNFDYTQYFAKGLKPPTSYSPSRIELTMRLLYRWWQSIDTFFSDEARVGEIYIYIEFELLFNSIVRLFHHPDMFVSTALVSVLNQAGLPVAVKKTVASSGYESFGFRHDRAEPRFKKKSSDPKFSGWFTWERDLIVHIQ